MARSNFMWKPKEKLRCDKVVFMCDLFWSEEVENGFGNKTVCA
jgi:hypothetical protein